MGHVHSDRLADLSLPRKLHDPVIAAGRAQPHHVLPETGWVSCLMNGPEDRSAAPSAGVSSQVDRVRLGQLLPCDIRPAPSTVHIHDPTSNSPSSTLPGGKSSAAAKPSDAGDAAPASACPSPTTPRSSAPAASRPRLARRRALGSLTGPDGHRDARRHRQRHPEFGLVGREGVEAPQLSRRFYSSPPSICIRKVRADRKRNGLNAVCRGFGQTAVDQLRWSTLRRQPRPPQVVLPPGDSRPELHDPRSDGRIPCPALNRPRPWHWLARPTVERQRLPSCAVRAGWDGQPTREELARGSRTDSSGGGLGPTRGSEGVLPAKAASPRVQRRSGRVRV